MKLIGGAYRGSSWRGKPPSSEEGDAGQLADGTVVLDADLAVQAARLSSDTGLPMADAIIYATAHALRAELVTSDAHFSGLPGVTLI